MTDRDVLGDFLDGHGGDPDADPAAVDPDHTPDPDYREWGQERARALPNLDR